MATSLFRFQQSRLCNMSGRPRRGNGASVVRIVPYAALHYATYEHYRSALVSTLQQTSKPDVSATRPPIWVDLLAGSCSGATAVAVTYPLDLLRTRLAWSMDTGSPSDGGQASPAPETTRSRGGHTAAAGRRSILGTLRAVVEEEGLRGLYRVRTLSRLVRDAHAVRHRRPVTGGCRSRRACCPRRRGRATALFRTPVPASCSIRIAALPLVAVIDADLLRGPMCGSAKATDLHRRGSQT